MGKRQRGARLALGFSVSESMDSGTGVREGEGPVNENAVANRTRLENRRLGVEKRAKSESDFEWQASLAQSNVTP